MIMSEKVLSKAIKVEEENYACAMESGSLMALTAPAVVAFTENAAAQFVQGELGDDELATIYK